MSATRTCELLFQILGRSATEFSEELYEVLKGDQAFGQTAKDTTSLDVFGQCHVHSCQAFCDLGSRLQTAVRHGSGYVGSVLHGHAKVAWQSELAALCALDERCAGDDHVGLLGHVDPVGDDGHVAAAGDAVAEHPGELRHAVRRQQAVFLEDVPGPGAPGAGGRRASSTGGDAGAAPPLVARFTMSPWTFPKPAWDILVVASTMSTRRADSNCAHWSSPAETSKAADTGL